MLLDTVCFVIHNDRLDCCAFPAILSLPWATFERIGVAWLITVEQKENGFLKIAEPTLGSSLFSLYWKTLHSPRQASIKEAINAACHHLSEYLVLLSIIKMQYGLFVTPLAACSPLLGLCSLAEYRAKCWENSQWAALRLIHKGITVPQWRQKCLWVLEGSYEYIISILAS